MLKPISLPSPSLSPLRCCITSRYGNLPLHYFEKNEGCVAFAHLKESPEIPTKPQRNMPNYQNGKVYRILQDGTKTVYVGSTVRTLSERMAQHRRNAVKQPQVMLYTHMAKVGMGHFTIELIVDCPCDRREVLNRAEGEQIRRFNTMNDGCNMVLPGQTDPESSPEQRLERAIERSRERVAKSRATKTDSILDGQTWVEYLRDPKGSPEQRLERTRKRVAKCRATKADAMNKLLAGQTWVEYLRDPMGSPEERIAHQRRRNRERVAKCRANKHR